MNKIIMGVCTIFMAALICFSVYVYVVVYGNVINKNNVVTEKNVEEEIVLSTEQCAYKKDNENGEDKRLLIIKHYKGYIYNIYRKQEFKFYDYKEYERTKNLLTSVHNVQEYTIEKDFESRIRKCLDETQTWLNIDESNYFNTKEEDLIGSYNRISSYNHKSKDGKFEYEDYMNALSDEWVCESVES